MKEVAQMTDIDASKPNAARVYDYLLGGSHNFEADRIAAERLLTIMPSARNGARLNRWFMFEAIQRLSESHFSAYLDLASGLPTEDYIHNLVPDARVLYNDIDPVTVAYAKGMIGDNPRVLYLQSNILDLDTILEAAEKHFQGDRKIGISLVGVAYFFDDDQLRSILQRLYDWCAPGSRMAISWLEFPAEDNERFLGVLENYRRMGTILSGRTPEHMQRLLGAWQIVDPGIRQLTEWNQVGEWRDAEDDGLGGNMHGCIVQKA
jgi:SAM-dependent methyltransferase